MIFFRIGNAGRWRGGFFVGAVLLLTVGAVVTWWWFHGPAPVVPPMPPDIPDAEVRQAVERARQKVLDELSDANTWGHLGMILMAHQLFSEADRCFAEAARLNPHSPNWPYGRARSPSNAIPTTPRLFCGRRCRQPVLPGRSTSPPRVCNWRRFTWSDRNGTKPKSCFRKNGTSSRRTPEPRWVWEWLPWPGTTSEPPRIS